MRKLFNSKKAGLKNESTVKFLDSLKSWGFFIVACCVTLFMYIYAHSNNEFVLADGTDSGSTTTPTTHIVTLKYYVDDDDKEITSTSDLLNSPGSDGNSIGYKLRNDDTATSLIGENKVLATSISIDSTDNLIFEILGSKCFFEKALIDEGKVGLGLASDTSNLDVGKIEKTCTIKLYFLSKRKITLKGNSEEEGIKYAYKYVKNTVEVNTPVDSNNDELYVPNGYQLKINAELQNGYEACANKRELSLEVDNIAMTLEKPGNYTYETEEITGDKTITLSRTGLRKNKITIPISVLDDSSVKNCYIYIWEGNDNSPSNYDNLSPYDMSKQSGNLVREWSALKFKIFIVPKPGYGKDGYTLKVNGVNVESGDLIKTYDNSFNNDYEVLISGVNRNNYTIKFTTSDSYKITARASLDENTRERYKGLYSSNDVDEKEKICYSVSVEDDGTGQTGLNVTLIPNEGYRFQNADKSEKITVKRGSKPVLGKDVQTTTGYTLSDYSLTINLSDIKYDTTF